MISKLPALLERDNIDQKTLAKATGLSQTTVSKMARGHFSRIDNHTVTSLCVYFKLKTISDLIEIEIEEGDFNCPDAAGE